MVKFLLDTNALSEPIRPKPNKALMQRLRAHDGQIGITVITWHEVVFGLERLPKGKKRDAIQAYLYDSIAPAIPIFLYDARAAERHAHERARLERSGKTPAFADGQIAAIAIVHDLVLVSRNIKDFKRFAGLRVADWFSPQDAYAPR